MKDVRASVSNMPEVSTAWQESIAPAVDTIRTRFERLALKDRPILCRDPVPEEDIGRIRRHLNMFPGLDVTKLTKATTRKLKENQGWLDIHCRERQYSTQFRKCENTECCPAPRLPREKLMWLPDPILDETGEHYKP